VLQQLGLQQLEKVEGKTSAGWQNLAAFRREQK